MSCTNCFNGCAEIVSDQCVKYTGVDVPLLGIQNGDTLATVENAITTFLVPVLTGVGVKPIISESIICNVVKQFLPTCTQCTGFTLNEVLTAIIKAACSLQEQIDDLVTEFETLNGNYDVDCLNGVTSSSGTHDILQAAINKICELEVNLGALALDLATKYYTKTQVDTLVANYVPPSANLVKSKMIPYVALPFFSTDFSMFDIAGAGIGDWVDIYLCNGSSHPQAPDIRGRVLVGVTTNVPGGPMDPAVIPNMGTGGFNPSYTLNTIYGNNSVTLGIPEMPSHTHVATSTAPDHSHGLDSYWHPTTSGILVDTAVGVGTRVQLRNSTNPASITITTNIDPIGDTEPHSNIQPVIACNYIIYIP